MQGLSPQLQQQYHQHTERALLQEHFPGLYHDNKLRREVGLEQPLEGVQCQRLSS